MIKPSLGFKSMLDASTEHFLKLNDHLGLRLAFSRLMINISKQVINLQEIFSVLITVCLIEEMNNVVKDDYINLKRLLF